MSTRYEIYHKDKGLAFGNDHACGEFLQIWDLSKGKQPDVDNILVDEDRFTGFNPPKMLKLLKEHGFALDELKNVLQCGFIGGKMNPYLKGFVRDMLGKWNLRRKNDRT